MKEIFRDEISIINVLEFERYICTPRIKINKNILLFRTFIFFKGEILVYLSKHNDKFKKEVNEYYEYYYHALFYIKTGLNFVRFKARNNQMKLSNTFKLKTGIKIQ